MKTPASSRDLLFQFHGVPPFGTSVSLALQHLVAMIVGCVTPPIIIAGAIGLSQADRVLLIQASLVMSAVSTLLQLFPIGKRFGSGLPVILGVSFAYVPSMQAIAASGGGVSAIAGAMLVGGLVAIVVGVFVKKIRLLFPPVITGTVVFTIGLSLYPTAINYMAGGTANTYEAVTAKGLTEALVYGSWQNWLVAALTLTAVMILNNHGKGLCKLASILLGMIFGYIVALCFGMVSFADVGTAAWFSLPRPLTCPAVWRWACCSPSTPFRPLAILPPPLWEAWTGTPRTANCRGASSPTAPAISWRRCSADCPRRPILRTWASSAPIRW